MIVAIRTNPAGVNQTTHTDAISGFKFAYLATHFGHFANNFMAGHHGKCRVTPLIAYLMNIGVTNPAVENLNLDIGRGRIAPFKAEGFQWRVVIMGSIANSLLHKMLLVII